MGLSRFLSTENIANKKYISTKKWDLSGNEKGGRESIKAINEPLSDDNLGFLVGLKVEF